MKHAQRQYAIKRLNEIYQSKVQGINQTFAAAEATRTDAVKPISHHYPTFGDIVRKIAGLENNVVLTEDYQARLTELEVNTSSYFYPSQWVNLLAKPINNEAVEAYQTYVEANKARHKVQVQDKLDLLKNKLVESTDALILGNEEAAVNALAAFQAFEV